MLELGLRTKVKRIVSSESLLLMAAAGPAHYLRKLQNSIAISIFVSSNSASSKVASKQQAVAPWTWSGFLAFDVYEGTPLQRALHNDSRSHVFQETTLRVELLTVRLGYPRRHGV